MLDDLKYIAQKDTSDALGVAAKLPAQLRTDISVDWQPEREIHDVVYAGMGGSALAAELARVWLGPTKPFSIVRDYDLPASVNTGTLVIVASYSGNTEEELSALSQALDAGAQVITISSGGQLADLPHPHVAVPGGLQPRMATGYMLKAVAGVFAAAGLASSEQLGELATAADFLDQAVAAWAPDVATKDNPAKLLAEELMGKSVVIYSGPKLWPAAYKWKVTLNETAKNLAWANQYPEFDHNEIMGWTSHPVDKVFAVVEIRSELEHARVQKRFELSERLLSGQRPQPTVVHVDGGSILESLMWGVALGDFVSIYLALLNGVDPTPVALLERFKQELT